MTLDAANDRSPIRVKPTTSTATPDSDTHSRTEQPQRSNFGRVESPERIEALRARLVALSWDAANREESLSELFNAIDALAIAELQYYFRRRTTRALISGVTRSAAWAFGTLGILAPLVAATAWLPYPNLASAGYVFLAFAASCLAANALFGGTSGHVRFVTTQLEIERLMTSTRINWCALLASEDIDDRNARCFKLIGDYAQRLYALTVGETGNWATSSLAELERYRRSIDSRIDSTQSG